MHISVASLGSYSVLFYVQEIWSTENHGKQAGCLFKIYSSLIIIIYIKYICVNEMTIVSDIFCSVLLLVKYAYSFFNSFARLM